MTYRRANIAGALADELLVEAGYWTDGEVRIPKVGTEARAGYDALWQAAVEAHFLTDTPGARRSR